MPSDPTLFRADRFTVRAALAPMMGEPRISAPLISQLLHGDVVSLLDGRGDWVRVAGVDEYEGWVHIGYLQPYAGSEPNWGWSLECIVEHKLTKRRRALPLGARIAPGEPVVHGQSVGNNGRVMHYPASAEAVARSAEEHYAGAPYLWGGVSPWGTDCSGLVQRLFALHSLQLPRDAWQQAAATEWVTDDPTADHAPGDLLFFSDRDDRRITHVGLALTNGRMVHSALARGGVTIEALHADDPYVDRLRTQCVGVHRVR